MRGSKTNEFTDSSLRFGRSGSSCMGRRSSWLGRRLEALPVVHARVRPDAADDVSGSCPAVEDVVASEGMGAFVEGIVCDQLSLR